MVILYNSCIRNICGEIWRKHKTIDIVYILKCICKVSHFYIKNKKNTHTFHYLTITHFFFIFLNET